MKLTFKTNGKYTLSELKESELNLLRFHMKRTLEISQKLYDVSRHMPIETETEKEHRSMQKDELRDIRNIKKAISIIDPNCTHATGK
jgi:DNA topoisomerase IA